MSKIKTYAQINKIRAAGKILAKVLREVSNTAREEITLKDLDDLARELILKAGARPAFLGYRPAGASKPYPSSICASVNEVVVHGVPTDRRLRQGDILKLDLGVNLDGWNADCAITLGIGNIGNTAKDLIMTAKDALEAAIAVSKAGNSLGDIGWAIQSITKKRGFKIIKGLAGHGIGERVHEEPSVFNEGLPGKGEKLKSGMVLAIEPMISIGSDQIVQLEDDSYKTADSSLSAHFEHTIVITDDGCEILTVL